MIRYQNITLPSGDNENRANALDGIGERKRKVRAFWLCSTQGTSTADASQVFRVYLDQLQILEIPLTMLLGITVSSVQSNPGFPWRIPVDMDIQEGEGLQVANYDSSSTTPNFNVVMEYEDI